MNADERRWRTRAAGASAVVVVGDLSTEEIDLDEGPAAASRFLGTMLAYASVTEATHVRFDSTRCDGGLLVNGKDGWYEMAPIADEMRDVYFRHLAELLFGSVRSRVYRCLPGVYASDPVRLCSAVAGDVRSDWNATLKHRSIWFDRVIDP
jgi:hypothetical protein